MSALSASCTPSFDVCWLSKTAEFRRFAMCGFGASTAFQCRRCPCSPKRVVPGYRDKKTCHAGAFVVVLHSRGTPVVLRARRRCECLQKTAEFRRFSACGFDGSVMFPCSCCHAGVFSTVLHSRGTKQARSTRNRALSHYSLPGQNPGQNSDGIRTEAAEIGRSIAGTLSGVPDATLNRCRVAECGLLCR